MFIASLFDRSFDPARARRLPIRSDADESTVRGLYLVGEIAGIPLIKLGLNRGRAVVDHIARNFDGTRDGQGLDVLIVGAGSSGLGAADRCQELGLRYLVIEQQRVAQLIRDFTKGKPLYMEPADEDNRTRLFCEECPKERLLEEWDRQVVELGLAPQIHEFETVTEIQRLRALGSQWRWCRRRFLDNATHSRGADLDGGATEHLSDLVLAESRTQSLQSSHRHSNQVRELVDGLSQP